MKWKKLMSGVLTGAMVLSSLAPTAVMAAPEVAIEESTEEAAGEAVVEDDAVVENDAVEEIVGNATLIADFNFDDGLNENIGGFGLAGFEGGSSYALVNGDSAGATLVDRDAATGDKALYLTNNTYLTLMDPTTFSNPVIGAEELVISYDINVQDDNTNWPFFLSKNTSEQTFQQEVYFGGLHKGGNITVERYNNSGARSEAVSGATGAAAGTWQHVDVVATENDFSVYLDGKQVGTTVSSTAKLSEIIGSGSDSVFQIGKANRTSSGEYMNAYLDNFKVYVGTFDVTATQSVAQYTFEDSLQNTMAADDAAQAIVTGLGTYGSSVVYADGHDGKALKLGDYGIRLNKKNLGTDYTVNLWMKPDGTFNENQAIVFLGYDGTENWVGLAGNTTGTNITKFWTYSATLGYSWTTMATPTLNSGAWHMVTMTGTDGDAQIYMDGELVARTDSLAKVVNALEGENQDILIGVNNWDPEFTGLVDDLSVYDQVLTAEEIKTLYGDGGSDPVDPVDPYQAKLDAMDMNNILGDNTSLDKIVYNLDFPYELDGNVLSWKSSDTSVVRANGKVTNPTTGDVKVTLTVTMQNDTQTATRTVEITVKALDNADLLELIAEAEALDSTYLDAEYKANLDDLLTEAKAANTQAKVDAVYPLLDRELANPQYMEAYVNPWPTIEAAAPPVTKTMAAGTSETIFTLPEAVADMVTVEYMTSDSMAATYTDGVVKALDPGKTTVTAVITSKYDMTVMEYSTALTITGSAAVSVGKVTGVKATATTNTVKLSWKKVSGATGYVIERAKGSSTTYKKLKTIKSGSTVTFTNRKLAKGTAYKYRIYAYVTINGKDTNGAKSAVRKIVTKPAQVTKLTVKRTTAVSKSTKATLSFKKATGATRYEIRTYNKSTKKWVIAYKVQNSKLYKYNTSTKKYTKVGKVTTKSGKLVCNLTKLNLKKAKSMKFKVRAVTVKSGYTASYGAYSKTVTLK